MRHQSAAGLSADQIEEHVARIWQIAQCDKKQVWPPIVGLYRAVALTLVYVRQYLNQAAVGDLFGVSQSTVSRVYRYILPLIGQALCLHVPNLEEAIRGRLVLVDGTDVPTGNRVGHEDNYSGKRRRAGLNIQVAADTDGGLLGISIPLPGAMHNRTAFTGRGWEDLLADAPVIADPAYQGTHAITPRKKPKGGELSVGDKANNMAYSWRRPPSRSRRVTLMSASTGSGNARSGLAWIRAGSGDLAAEHRELMAQYQDLGVFRRL